MDQVFSKHRDAGRRLFLKISAAAGLGVFVNGDGRAVSAIEQQCGYRLSAYEALTMLTDLMFRIQSNSFVLLNKRIERVATDCQDQFSKLCTSVELLTTKLSAGTNSGEQAQRLKVLAELGCSSAAGLANATSPQSSTAMLKSLEIINREIGLAVQQLLPDGETVLNPEATAVLRSIVVQVHQTAALQRSINDSRQSLGGSRELIVHGIQSIQELIFYAGNEILVAESGSAAKNLQARKDAVDLLGKARTKLVELIAELKTQQLYSQNSAADFLLLALEGTKQWVDNPASVGVSSEVIQKSQPVRARGGQSYHHAVSVGFDPAEITGHLRNYCPPDGVVHVGQVITAMTSVLGWKVAMQAAAALHLRGPVTAGEVLAAVRLGLNALLLSCRPYKDQVPDPEKLTQELTRIIMS